jgi:hypothetical protein
MTGELFAHFNSRLYQQMNKYVVIMRIVIIFLKLKLFNIRRNKSEEKRKLHEMSISKKDLILFILCIHICNENGSS